MAERSIIDRILELIPQQPPFRFISDILAVNDKAITAVYQFCEDEYFYKGHFPKNPITPGVILIETMAQTVVVAMGIYLALKKGISTEEIKQMTTLFAFADEIEFSGIVSPGEKVIIKGDIVYFRKNTLKTRGQLIRENGETVCTGILTGAGVKLGNAGE